LYPHVAREATLAPRTRRQPSPYPRALLLAPTQQTQPQRYARRLSTSTMKGSFRAILHFLKVLSGSQQVPGVTTGCSACGTRSFCSCSLSARRRYLTHKQSRDTGRTFHSHFSAVSPGPTSVTGTLLAERPCPTASPGATLGMVGLDDPQRSLPTPTIL